MRLLIDREHDRVRGGRQIEADDVRGFGLEVGIITRDVALQPMRFQPGSAPHETDRVVAHPDQGRQAARRPVRIGRRRRFLRFRKNLRFDAWVQPIAAPRARQIGQRRDAPLDDAAFPPRDVAIGHPVGGDDLRIRVPIGKREDHARPAGEAGRDRRRAEHARQDFAVLGRKQEVHRGGEHARFPCKRNAIHISITIH